MAEREGQARSLASEQAEGRGPTTRGDLGLARNKLGGPEHFHRHNRMGTETPKLGGGKIPPLPKPSQAQV